MNIHPIMQNGIEIVPSFQLPNEKGRAIGIQTNVQRKTLLLKQFIQNRSIYVALTSDGLYGRLKVHEYIRYLKQMSGEQATVEQLLHTLHLHSLQKMKISDLQQNEKAFLASIQIYFVQYDTLVLEEPFYYLEDRERIALKEILERLSKTKSIIILTSNLEDALISCDCIYRLDDTGFHLLDIADEESGQEFMQKEDDFKIQKIQTKRDDKTILFNPPEIDYIESMNGEIVVHVGGDTYSCNLTLTELEKRLQYYGFFRCHRSYIVNLQKVREMITWTKNSYSLRLTTGKDSVVPLSRTKLAELKQLLNL